MPIMLWELNADWARRGAPAGVVQPGEFGTAQEWAEVSGHPYQYDEGGIVSAAGTYFFGGLPLSLIDPKMPMEARLYSSALGIPRWGGYAVSVGVQIFGVGTVLTLLDPLDLYRGGIIPDKYARETIAPAWAKFNVDVRSKPPLSIAKQLQLFLPV